jgi:uncharacterized membrane protein
MIKRLASVIHWFGFLAGFIASLFLVAVVILQDTPPNTGIFSVLLVAFVAVTMPFLTALPAWLISWILTGNKSFFPWKS